MFTDIAGYTALMGSDEKRALEVLDINRQIHTKYLEKYSGTLIKEMGDGMLVCFDLASDAVRCAIEIQIACREENIPLTVGIHEAEVVFQGSDVFGDGVNIASRLQTATAKGCITISESVYRDVKNKADIKTRFIEAKELKNVDEPIRIYSVSSEERPAAGPRREPLKPRQARPGIDPKLRKIWIATPVIALLIAITIFITYGSTTIPFTERDWIVISDFENLTDETIFDHSLNTAFALSLDQSRYVNVLPRQRMIETSARMDKGDVTNIDEETAQEIALREGVEIIVAPTISRVGNQYILTAKTLECETGNILKSEVLYAESENDIIDKLDQLSRKVRRSLGESRSRISNQSKPLRKVTTSSLQALKQYSLGIDSHLRLDIDSARIYYENAIGIDSNFTAAKASLGNLLYERFDRDEGRKWLDEAMLTIDDLTEREKLGILAFYAVNIGNDLEKGIAYTKKRIGLYPDDAAAHNNLGWYFQRQGLFNPALEEYKKALQINPNMMLTNGGIIWIYLEYLGQMDSALAWSNRMVEYAPENPWGHFYLGSSYVGLNDLEKAEAAYGKAGTLNPGFAMKQYRLAHTYRLRGMYDKAVAVLESILDQNAQEVSAHYDLGINYDLMGEGTKARNHYLEYGEVSEKWLDEHSDDPKTYIYNGIIRTRLGEKKAGWELGKRGIELDSTIYIEFSKLLAVQDRKGEALDYLEKALENGYRDLVMIKLHPDLQLLFKEPRFMDLMDRYF